MDELKALLEKLNKAFFDYKAENDQRLSDMEKKGHTDPLADEKIRNIASDVAKLQSMQIQMESIEKAIALMQAPGGGKSDKGEEKVYANIGEQLKDIAIMGMPNPNRSDYTAASERLMKIQAEASGAGETIPSEGGFLVDTDKASMLDRNVIATGLLSQRCFNVPCSANSNSLELNLMDESSRATGSRFGGIQVYMKAEADLMSGSKPKFRQPTWKLKDVYGIFYATNDLLRDASQLTAVVNRWFPIEFGFKIDDQIVNGNGGGNALGIVNAGCTVSQAVFTGQGTRASNANKIIYENVVQMNARLLSSSDADGIWLVNRELLPDIMLMTLPVGTGGAAVYLPPNGAAGRPYSTLLGRSILPIEQCQAPGTVGDIILADLNEYLLLTKGGIESAASIHVRFLYDEMTFRWVYRFDGAPIRNKSLTPYKGSNALGPFVTLAAS